MRARVGAVLLLALVSGCSGSSDDPDASSSTSSPSPSPSLLPTPTFPGPPDGVTVTEVDGGPVGLAAVGDEVWAALITSGEVLAGDGPRVPVGDAPLRLVSTPDGVWVSVISDGKIVRIDPRSGGVDLTVELKPAGSEPEGLAYADGVLWVVDQANDRVLPVDPATGHVGDAVPVGDAPRLAAVGTRGVWVSVYGAGAIALVQPGSGLPYIAPSKTLGQCITPQGLAEAGGVLWVACTVESRVVGVDVDTMKVVAVFDGIGSADAVVARGDTAYVVGQQGPTVWAIDAKERSIGDPLVLDELGGVSENVDGALVGDSLVVSHPTGGRLYDVPLSLLD